MLRFGLICGETWGVSALKKRSDAADMIVEEALLRLENDDLDLWMDIGEAMNKAPYHGTSGDFSHFSFKLRFH